MENPETLFGDLYKTGGVSNRIFYSDKPLAWHKALTKHYPSIKKKGNMPFAAMDGK